MLTIQIMIFLFTGLAIKLAIGKDIRSLIVGSLSLPFWLGQSLINKEIGVFGLCLGVSFFFSKEIRKNFKLGNYDKDIQCIKSYIEAAKNYLVSIKDKIVGLFSKKK